MIFICLVSKFIDRFALCALRFSLCLCSNLCPCIATSMCTHTNVTIVIDVLVIVFWTNRGRIGYVIFS